ncbi:MAG: nucleotide sugar dehydrogenase [Alphaproteobacteria bacterium]|nr:nucleotide sugar dehydrogenase [Alphaproteobacteria bacterium]
MSVKLPEPAKARVGVIGLGYVGLPLAVALARGVTTIGFDIDKARVGELARGHDRTNEIEKDRLTASKLKVTSDVADIAGLDVYIVTVPTPVDVANRPDLGAVLSACRTVGKVMRKGAVVVLESTVYPGVTEEVCIPVLEQASGLKWKADFNVGYSPERINPGDKERRFDTILKIVSADTSETLDIVDATYRAVVTAGTHRAGSIKVAEFAKVIENAQRDINIAFMNEIAMIFGKIGVSVHDVLAAAGTKWNFLRFTPGLVGGHCIGVDPYYLADLSQRLGHHPEVILAGRRINDAMAGYVATRIARELVGIGGAGARRILVLGLTFKENVPDLRNSKVADLVRALAEWGHQVDVLDPICDGDEAKHEYGFAPLKMLQAKAGYDAIVGAVSHDAFAAWKVADFQNAAKPGALIADIKGMWRGRDLPGFARWEL